MELGMVGLGKMGANMTRRLMKGGHRVVAFDLSTETVEVIEKEGAVGAKTLEAVKAGLKAPRVLWIMVPSGDPTEKTLAQLADLLDPGDIIIDGGNSNYKDTVRRAGWLKEKKLNFVDVGTSGGVWGLKEGYSMMVGGDDRIVKSLQPIFETLAPASDRGWGHVGSNGAGHFVKMVHNGIEYGLMQAYAEGFEIMEKKPEYDLDLHQIAGIWQYGSVIRSWLLDLTKAALEKDQKLSDIKPWVADSGEGRWTAMDAIDLDVPAPVITLALMMRLVSRNEENFAARLLAAMRHQFGGHAVKEENDK
jgi:6-phosphogluconate dehydrogenase